jgi:uncharacterized protein YutE (UPF0331/DUF86 family)
LRQSDGSTGGDLGKKNMGYSFRCCSECTGSGLGRFCLAMNEEGEESRMINGVIVSKLQTLDEVLGELRSLGKIKTADMEKDWRLRRAIERDLQVLSEIVIDVCQRLISMAGQSPATSGVEAIARCVGLGVLGSVEPYRKMIQFRNFIVHRYERVDVNILTDIVDNRLGDFDQFRKEVMTYVSRRLEES